MEKRVEYIDALKGIGILCVVWGHLNIPGILRGMIYMFHMPLFFVISGFLHTNQNSIKELFKKKAKSLLYPYFVIGLIYIVHNSLIDYVKNGVGGGTARRLIALLYGNYIYENNVSYIGTLWFLAALFCAEMIFEITIKVSKKVKKSNIFLFCLNIIIFLIGCVLAHYINVSRDLTAYGSGYRLPYCLDVAFISTIFYYVGFVAKHNEKIFEGSILKRIFAFTMLGIFGVSIGVINSIMLDSSVDMLYLRIGNPILFVLAGASISLALFGMCSALYEKTKIKIIESFGRYSLLIMAFHLPLYTYTSKLIGILGFDNVIVNFVFLVCISWLVAYLVAKYAPWVYKFKILSEKQ